jgi:hypothetical protein
MARKKAYQHFERLTKQATASAPAGVEPDHGSVDGAATGLADETLPVRLSPDVRRALEHRAAAEGTTPAQLIEAAVRRYLGVWR